MKKAFIIGAILFGTYILGSASQPQFKGETFAVPTPAIIQSSPQPSPTILPSPKITPTPSPVLIPTPTPVTNNSTGLSNDDYYTNVDGNEVHAPAYSNTVPPGATAICRDGTYSFSQHRQGTCSHHGGVAQWL